ncbi:GNAT family N-acetyltransferase [Bacillus sp. AFS040349]|uniref:GNAT family N-acetyltransferase n=1 Tax=Bacillus sp. AFS040349 TaxID=2033502 RepID=UPI000BFCD8A1|nr:GNAT family N-acetyltransferase [Bacillus sp. AFS040349]PGT79077.1 histone acetyltransferase [Bacillus sp. AFS040349]
MTIKVIEATKDDVHFLWDMLYEAVYVDENSDKPPRSIIETPEMASYVKDWGRHGDLALLAVDSNEDKLGAIWIRLFDDINKTYGYIDKETPILSMATLPQYRGKGIGSELLKEIKSQAASKGYLRISLSVDPSNPARRLYERFGFQKTGIDGTSWNMVAELGEL